MRPRQAYGYGAILDTIKEFGIAEDMIGRIYGHVLRLGYTRDVAHLPAKVSDGTGLVTDNVRVSVSYS